MKDNEVIIFNLLNEVFAGKAYSGIKLNETLSEIENDSHKAYITRVFYGVIEKSVQFDFLIEKLCDKKPKNNVIILIKIGFYLLRYTDTPSYAAINKTVSLAKNIGKSGVSGFVNAILRKSTEIDLEKIEFSNVSQKLSVLYSYPLWVVKTLIKDYGLAEATGFLSYQKPDGTHIRHNGFRISKEEFDKKLKSLVSPSNKTLMDKNKKIGVFCEENTPITTSKLGYYVKHDIMKCLPPNLFTAQSYSSMIAVHAYLSDSERTSNSIKTVLDICSAPGGKAVYLKELFPSLQITCCDIHPHRLKLIDEYAARMGAGLSVELNDGTILREEWQDKFDLVICDVPCSGLGLVNSKPDIILNRTQNDIETLAKIQAKILSVSAKYVRKGGIICYSTCTVTKQENDDIISKFLANFLDFELLPIKNQIINSDGAIQLLPQTHGCDGFYIAKMKRK